MKKLIIVFLIGVSCQLFGQERQDPGFELAIQLRPNVVRISSGLREGFGLIFAEKQGYVFIVTSKRTIANPEQIQVSFFDGTKPYLNADAKIRNDIPDLTVLRVKAKAPDGWTKNCYTDEVSNYSKVWFIGRSGKWYVPSRSSIGVTREVSSTKILFDIGSIEESSAGGPLLSEKGILGIITSDSPEESEALRISQVKRVLINSGYPFDLEPRMLASANANDNCKLMLQYMGVGKSANDTDVPLNVYLKTLKINGKNVELEKDAFPMLLSHLPCGKVTYHVEGDLTNGTHVWKGLGEGLLDLALSDKILLTWAINRNETIEIKLKQ
jgi:hypothetical protein